MSINNAAFNPREHLITIKNRQGGVSDYLPVQWRLVWFRTEFPEGSIETEVVIIDLDRVVEAEQFVWNAEKRRNEKIVKAGKGFACFKATVRTGQGGSASATGSESAVDFGDFIEKAETKAIGRALAGLGFGTQFAPELNEGQRIVDAPVDLQSSSSNVGNGNVPAAVQANQSRSVASNGNAQQADATEDANTAISERQLSSIRKLCEVLGKAEPDNVTTISSLSAKKLIQQLTAEYRQQHTRAS
jgi:hypothetical protein